jgi:GNAT superfamily N-acetyltransferase
MTTPAPQPALSPVLAPPVPGELPQAAASITAGFKALVSLGWSWVPIRSMAPRHRVRIAAHLTALNERDRYLRFGYAASDGQIAKYVDMLDFERDEVFGIFNRRLEIIAMAHVAYAPAAQREGQPAMAEFGVSVLPQARGRRYGARLFEHAVLHARNRGCESLFIHALSENAAMLRIARQAGATVERDGSESEAWLKLPPETLRTHMDELFAEHVAELDYQFKCHAHRVNEVLKTIGEIKTHINDSTPAATE